MTLNLVKGEFTELEDALRAQVKLLQEKGEKLLLMVAKRDQKIEDLKHELKKLQVDKELLKGRIEELDHRHFEETPITFDDD